QKSPRRDHPERRGAQPDHHSGSVAQAAAGLLRPASGQQRAGQPSPLHLGEAAEPDGNGGRTAGGRSQDSAVFTVYVDA
nr:hypothetical protein [Tanacetum cinerariifolium]